MFTCKKRECFKINLLELYLFSEFRLQWVNFTAIFLASWSFDVAVLFKNCQYVFLYMPISLSITRVYVLSLSSVYEFQCTSEIINWNKKKGGLRLHATRRNVSILLDLQRFCILQFTLFQKFKTMWHGKRKIWYSWSILKSRCSRNGYEV